MSSTAEQASKVDWHRRRSIVVAFSSCAGPLPVSSRSLLADMLDRAAGAGRIRTPLPRAGRCAGRGSAQRLGHRNATHANFEDPLHAMIVAPFSCWSNVEDGRGRSSRVVQFLSEWTTAFGKCRGSAERPLLGLCGYSSHLHERLLDASGYPRAAFPLTATFSRSAAPEPTAGFGKRLLARE
jgi:hypothetical protein